MYKCKINNTYNILNYVHLAGISIKKFQMSIEKFSRASNMYKYNNYLTVAPNETPVTPLFPPVNQD